jgi:hypothetical protein
LANINWSSETDCGQDYWNEFENKLINMVDEMVPMKMKAKIVLLVYYLVGSKLN